MTDLQLVYEQNISTVKRGAVKEGDVAETDEKTLLGVKPTRPRWQGGDMKLKLMNKKLAH